MVNKTILILCLMSLKGFTQMSINQTQSPQELVNLLIGSAPIITSNISIISGNNFGSTNGIGSFTNTNENLEITSGLILCTGDAAKTYPFIENSVLSDGSINWIGDNDIQTNLDRIQPNRDNLNFNASILQFDFNSNSTNISFDYVFASEEYGSFQCGFTDMFLFLITDLETMETKNIATVPNNVDIPVSATTIRNNAHNSGCSSANLEYFKGIYQRSTDNPPTNYLGLTTKLTATTSIIPNRNYRIKLVISDYNDTSFDSAVFLQANSFIATPVEVESCIDCTSFNLIKSTTNVISNYLVSGWVKESNPTMLEEQMKNFVNATLRVSFKDADGVIIGTEQDFHTSGEIIDGWQRIIGEFTVPENADDFTLELVNKNSTDSGEVAYFDDIRVLPTKGNMKSFVYDQKNQRLMAELDENNYGTFYEYDMEGGLVRIKKETEKGVFTIQETRSGNAKIQD